MTTTVSTLTQILDTCSLFTFWSLIHHHCCLSEPGTFVPRIFAIAEAWLVTSLVISVFSSTKKSNSLSVGERNQEKSHKRAYLTRARLEHLSRALIIVLRSEYLYTHFKDATCRDNLPTTRSHRHTNRILLWRPNTNSSGRLARARLAIYILVSVYK